MLGQFSVYPPNALGYNGAMAGLLSVEAHVEDMLGPMSGQFGGYVGPILAVSTQCFGYNRARAGFFSV